MYSRCTKAGYDRKNRNPVVKVRSLVVSVRIETWTLISAMAKVFRVPQNWTFEKGVVH